MDKVVEAWNDVIDNFDLKGQELAEYYAFEPFDVEKRNQAQLDRMKKDGVDLYDPEIVEIIGKDPHRFQTGFLLGNPKLGVLQAGTQAGKTACAEVDAICRLTGEVPVSMRYDEGVDTGYKRPINNENIKRWGRYDVRNGKFLGYSTTEVKDGTWDCGNIIGVGRYPQEKICMDPGATMWIGTFKQARDEHWWPKLKKLIPSYLLDQTKGVGGFSEKDHRVYFLNGKSITIITYEQGHQRFEAEKVWHVYMDEEPPNEKIFHSIRGHCRTSSLIFTPYMGLTWSKKVLFDRVVDDLAIELFHCTQYDSPYQDDDDVDTAKRTMPSWEIDARVWGLHSTQRGKPFFDHSKLRRMRKHKNPVLHYASFYPNAPCDKVLDLMGTDVKKVEENALNEEDVWEIYEDCEPGVGYALSLDTAKGSSDERETKDRTALVMWKKEQTRRGFRPKMVASLWSYLEIHQLAFLALYACRYYNNALLSPESKSEPGGAFVGLTRDWPWYYHMSVVNQQTRRITDHLGFDTNARTRTSSFVLIYEDIAEISEHDHDYVWGQLLHELEYCICGKNGRPDHMPEGTLDAGMAWAIAQWVCRHSPEQVRCNRNDKEENERLKRKRERWEARHEKANGRKRLPKMGYKR